MVYYWISFKCRWLPERHSLWPDAKRLPALITWLFWAGSSWALPRWKGPSSSEVKGALPSTEASSYWLSLSPSSSTCRRGSLLRPPASWSVPWDLHSDFLQLAFPFLILAQLLLTCTVHIHQSKLTWIYSMFLLSLVLRRSPCWEQAVTSCPNAPMPHSTTRTKGIWED